MTCKNGLTAGKQRLSLALLVQWLSLSNCPQIADCWQQLSCWNKTLQNATTFYLTTTHILNIRWNYFSIERSPIFERELFFGMSPHFARCPSSKSGVYVNRSVERLWSDTDRGTEVLTGEQKYWQKNLSQCHFVHHIFHTEWSGIEPTPTWWEAGAKPPQPKPYGVGISTIWWRSINMPYFHPSHMPQRSWESRCPKEQKSKIQQIQRSFLIFITEAYKTVSHEALSAIAGIMPIEQAMHLYKDIRAISRGNPTNAVITELKKIEIPTKIRGIHPKDNHIRVDLSGSEGNANVTI